MHDEFITVPLTQGEVALISPEDSHLLQHRWHVCTKRRYACRNLKRGTKPRVSYMHREIMDAPSGMDVDHINRKTLDNRRGNLRVATRGTNNANGKMRITNSSGYRGVDWSKKDQAWRARINKQHLGYFGDPADAARAYDRRAREIYGENTYLNFP
jgi:hypothetical protein